MYQRTDNLMCLEGCAWDQLQSKQAGDSIQSHLKLIQRKDTLELITGC